MDDVLTQEQQDQEQEKIWNEVAAERNDDDAQPAAKPIDPVVIDVVATEVPDPAAPVVTPEAKPDPLAEALAKIESLEARTRKAEGFIGTLNGNQLQMQKVMEAAAKATTKVDDAPTNAQVQAAIKNPVEWDALKNDFPEWATATEKFMDAKLAGIKPAPVIDPAAIDKMVSERVAGQTADFKSQIIDSVLDSVMPGWAEEVRSEQFGKWIAGQSPEVQALERSSKVGDAAKMLRLYEVAKAANPTQSIINDRNKKLDAAASTGKGVKVPPAKSVDDMSDEELWNHEAKNRDKQRASRGY